MAGDMMMVTAVGYDCVLLKKEWIEVRRLLLNIIRIVKR
jgi:hypothetical protein